MTDADRKTIKGIETQLSTILKTMMGDLDLMEADSDVYELYLKIQEAKEKATEVLT